MRLGPRSYGYALVVAALIFVAGWVAQNTWRDLRQLRGSFVFMQADDLYISEHIEALIQDLNQTVVRVGLQRDRDDEINSQLLSQYLAEIVQTHQSTFTMEEQRRIMRQIQPALQRHTTLLSNLVSEAMHPGDAHSPRSFLEAVDRSAAPVLSLCRKLKASEFAEQAQFMGKSQRAFEWIEDLLIGTLIALAVLVSTTLVAIYRGVIGPLRSEVLHSRALVARSEKLASLGTLAAGVAHEIRNPLTAINVRLHTLKKSLRAHSSEEEDALVIGHEIDRLECLVQEFLQFGRPSEPKFVTVSVDSLLAKAQSLLAAKLEKNAIQLDLQFVPDIWLRADPHQIEQVLINLIQNAADSMASGGAITLRVHSGMRRLAGKVRPAVMIDVADTGQGISPEVQKRMFDPFFSTKEEGTGLGLAIALRIMEKHGGALEFRSILNSGTTFTILFPDTKPEEERAAAT